MANKNEIDFVEQEKFPRDVRAVVNDLVELANRVWEVHQASGFETVPRFELTDDKVVLIVPPLGRGNADNGGDFGVTIRRTAGGTFVRGVNHKSFIYGSLDHTDVLDIDGLLTKDNPQPDDAGWVVTNTTDVVWIEADVDTSSFPFDVSNVHIASLANGDSFPDLGEVGNDGGATPGMPPFSQARIRLAIAIMGDDGSGNPVVKKRVVRSSLRVVQGQYNDSVDDDGNNENVIFSCYLYPTG